MESCVNVLVIHQLRMTSAAQTDHDSFQCDFIPNVAFINVSTAEHLWVNKSGTDILEVSVCGTWKELFSQIENALVKWWSRNTSHLLPSPTRLMDNQSETESGTFTCSHPIQAPLSAVIIPELWAGRLPAVDKDRTADWYRLTSVLASARYPWSSEGREEWRRCQSYEPKSEQSEFVSCFQCNLFLAPNLFSDVIKDILTVLSFPKPPPPVF